MKQRPHNLQASRAGAVLGGVLGFAPALITAFLFFPDEVPDSWWEALMACVLVGGFGGAFLGLMGGQVGRWIRDRRAGSWSDYRASLAGGYVAGFVGGLCMFVH
ncbi:hypothetical protein [Alienimonas chondri]|uniref:Uncharacterized protein n=1 Tax=Alienimonas chondri TaxID=2681879 RepID=A0ABX1VB92_9PLAN|nr:hypothetical protein [Alienimonas chondri]NNJ24755.1 hypothetical protein [Alienimonas chondri]